MSATPYRSTENQASGDERTSAARPSRMLRVALSYWVFEAALALLVALPVRAVVERAYGQHPDGDAVLFRPGALELTELVYRFDPPTSLFPTLLVTVAVLAVVVGHLPLAGAIAYLDGEEDWARIALRSFFRMIGAFAAFGVVRWLVVIGGVALASWVASSRTELHGEVSAFQWAVASFVPFALLAWALATTEDYAYVAVVKTQRLGDAAGATYAALRRKRLGPALYFGAQLAAQALCIGIASTVAASLGGQGGFALFVLFVVHQCVQLARIGLKVRWLAYVVDEQRRASD